MGQLLESIYCDKKITQDPMLSSYRFFLSLFCIRKQLKCINLAAVRCIKERATNMGTQNVFCPEKECCIACWHSGSCRTSARGWQLAALLNLFFQGMMPGDVRTQTHTNGGTRKKLLLRRSLPRPRLLRRTRKKMRKLEQQQQTSLVLVQRFTQH